MLDYNDWLNENAASLRYQDSIRHKRCMEKKEAGDCGDPVFNFAVKVANKICKWLGF